MDPTTYAYVIGAEFLVSLLLHSITIVKNCQILHYFWAHRRKGAVTQSGTAAQSISRFMMALLVGWLLNSLSYVPKELYILTVWRPAANLRDGNWIFWAYMPSLCQYSTVPVFVFFLTLDRILTIQLHLRYQNSLWARALLFWLALGMAAAVWVANFVAFCLRLPIDRKTECWTFTCLVGSGGMNFYLISRVVIAVPNCVGALVFLYLLCKFNQRLAPATVGQPQSRSRVNRYNNLMTLWAICSEFVLNFIPYFGPLLIQSLTGINIVANVGVFASMLSAVEGILFVGLYSRVLRRLDGSTSTWTPHQQGQPQQNHHRQLSMSTYPQHQQQQQQRQMTTMVTRDHTQMPSVN